VIHLACDIARSDHEVGPLVSGEPSHPPCPRSARATRPVSAFRHREPRRCWGSDGFGESGRRFPRRGV